MKNKLKAILKYPAILLFFAFILLYSVADSMVNDRRESELENRKLAQKPAMTVKNLLAAKETEKFSYLYEQYINDQFLGRDGWISLKSRAESVLLKTENNGVLYGKDGTMYQKFFVLDTAAGGGTQLETNIENVRQFIARHPGLVKVMIVPSADMVVTDKLPLAAPFVDEAPWMAQMAQVFAGDAVFLDPTQTLRGHADEYLFYRTDHHWTTLGAYYAYLQYAGAAGRDAASAAGLVPTQVGDFLGTLYSKTKLYNAQADLLSYYPQLDGQMTIVQLLDKADRDAVQQAYEAGQMSEEAYAQVADRVVDLYETDKLSTRDKYAMFLYGNNGFSRIEGEGKGKVLVIKDSYANCFVPFLTADYAQIDVVDLRSLKGTTVDALIAENSYDDVLVLYNFQSFSSDTNLVLLNRGSGN
ncbi:hypothetical protein H8S23_01835 [Anaerofilum sp. BX8]|uniref:DHHW protein n=1 Tax=Anaerofilum hominis TaxID=2763016 RepID=A0A923I4L6_9FIRM|nr:DHHW family protein [Anaerofilum hominis]MBC5580240.1 hypothetical protein [Anaerofilum hominis]